MMRKTTQYYIAWHILFCTEGPIRATEIIHNTKLNRNNEQLRQKLADLSDKYLEAIAELEKWHNHFPHVKDLK